MGEVQSLISLFDYLSDVHFHLKDEESRFIRVNGPMLRTHGLTHESEMIGKNVTSIFTGYFFFGFTVRDFILKIRGRPIMGTTARIFFSR